MQQGCRNMKKGMYTTIREYMFVLLIAVSPNVHRIVNYDKNDLKTVIVV